MRDQQPIPVLVALGAGFRELEAATPARRLPRPTLAVVLAIILVIALAAVAAATGLFHFGAAIAPPPPGDVVPSQIQLPATASVEPVTSPDPDGGPDWGIRVAQNSAGEPCFVVNRVLDGKLGTITGTEFHESPIRGPGSCGPAPDPIRYEVVQGSSAGADGAARTTVGGLVSAEVGSVTVNGPDGPRVLEISPHGAFVTVYPGIIPPRDLPVEVQLKDGSVQSYRSPGVPG